MLPHLKTCLNTALALLLSLPAFSQQPPWSVEWGRSYEYDKNTGHISRFIASCPEGIYAIRRTGGGIYLSDEKDPSVIYSSYGNKGENTWLELLDPNFKTVKSSPIGLLHEGMTLNLEDIISLKGKLYIISSRFDKKRDKNILFAQAVGKSSLSAAGEPAEVLEMDMSSKYRLPNCGIDYSPDSSKMLLHGSLTFQKGREERLNVSVWDSDMKLLWKKAIVLPYPENELTVEEYRLDNEGNAFILATRKQTERYIFAWRNGGADFKEYKAAIDQKQISGLTIRTLDNGDLQCAGFYSDREEDQVKGVFSYKLKAEDGSVYERNIQAFDVSTLTSDLSERRQEKAKENAKGGENVKKELENYRLQNLLMRPDGGMVLVGEHTFFSQVSYYSGSDWKSSTVRFFDDLLVAAIEPGGRLAWTCKIDKTQTTGGLNGYVPIVDGNRLHFMYKNDEPGAEIQVATVSSDGQVSYAPLTKDEDAILNTGAALKISADTLVFRTTSKKEHRFGKLHFQQ
jgi:hypothetical protein